MKKVSDIVGMEVVDSKGGAIGEVEGVLCSRARGRIMGIKIRRKKPARGQAIVHYKDILSFGDDLLIINDRLITNSADIPPEIGRVLEEEDVTGYTVLTVEGKELGTISDVMISEANGSIEGYLVAGDLFDDLVKGRKMLRLERTAMVGNGHITLDENSTGRSVHETGGLKNIFKLNEKN